LTAALLLLDCYFTATLLLFTAALLLLDCCLTAALSQALFLFYQNLAAPALLLLYCCVTAA
jgi:hypothetical protein